MTVGAESGFVFVFLWMQLPIGCCASTMDGSIAMHILIALNEVCGYEGSFMSTLYKLESFGNR